MESSAMPMIPECLLLYLVTDAPEHCSLGLAETVRRAIAGGVTLVQYRREHVDAATMLREAAELREITRAAGVPFIVNTMCGLPCRWARTACTWGNPTCLWRRHASWQGRASSSAFP